MKKKNTLHDLSHINCRGIIDQINGDYAVLEGEDGHFFNIPICLIPFPVYEGMFLSIKEGHCIHLKEEELHRYSEVDALLEQLTKQKGRENI